MKISSLRRDTHTLSEWVSQVSEWVSVETLTHPPTRPHSLTHSRRHSLTHPRTWVSRQSEWVSQVCEWVLRWDTHSCEWLRRRVPVLGQITWWIVCWQKMRGHSGKKIARKSRNSCRASGGVVGAHRQLTRGSNGLSPRTKYKRSKNTFGVASIALSCSRDWYSLLRSL